MVVLDISSYPRRFSTTSKESLYNKRLVTMNFTRDQLANQPHLRRLLSPEAEKELNLPPVNEPEKSEVLTPHTSSGDLKDLWAELSPAQKRSLKGTEAKVHAVILNFALKNKLPHIHGAYGRATHELPAGWPDFTFFRKIPGAFENKALFMEIKVPGGVLSFQQKFWLTVLDIHIVPNAYHAINLLDTFYDLHLPVYQKHPELDLEK